MRRRDFLRSLLAAPFCTACVDLVSPKAKVPAPVTLRSGPWQGVYDTPDPFDAGPNRLRGLLNGYVPDADAGSDAYARNGFALLNGGTAIRASFGQALFSVAMLDGTLYNFAIIGGHIYRFDSPHEGAGVTTYTDVTPVGVTINGSSPAPIYVTPMVSNAGGTTEIVLVVNDEVNKPWIASSLTATPIIGTSIDYDGAAVAWTAKGAPVVWQGAVFLILASVGGVARRQDVSWSEPGRPDLGWQQPTFDNNMTLVQHSPGPLYSLWATNLALYYFRDKSIGVMYGNLAAISSTNTQDLVGTGVGCTAPNTIQQYGSWIYFCDAMGRPYRMAPGGQPEPIWKQMRGVVNDWPAGDSGNNLAWYASSAIEPVHGLYVTTIRRANDTLATNFVATVAYVFNADTGTYQGEWTVFDSDNGSGGVGIAKFGIIKEDNLTLTLAFLGEASPNSGINGFLWMFRARGWPDTVIGVDDNQWLDGDSVTLNNCIQPNIKVTTDRMGEDADTVYLVDRATLLTGNAASCKVTAVTPNSAGQIEGTPAASAANDGTYRLTCGFDGVQGRGPSLIVAPVFNKTTAATLDQWSVARVSIQAMPSVAGPEEP